MKKFIFSSIIFLSTIIGLSSCLHNGDNYEEYKNLEAVVNYNPIENKTTLLALNTEFMFQAGAINPEYLEIGTCLIINHVKIDYDNQPSKKYYTISELSGVTKINKQVLQTENEVVVGEYELPILGMRLNFQSTQKGIIFSQILHADINAEYKMVYVPQAGDENTAKKTYLIAKSADNTISSIKERTEPVAFDINDLFTQSTDTVINNVAYKHIKVELHYLPDGYDATMEEEPNWDSKIFGLNLLVK